MQRNGQSSGVVSLTHAAQFALPIASVQSRPDLVQKGAQRQQVDHAESRPPRGDTTEDVGRCKICQSNGDARQRPVGRTVDHPFLAPVLTPADQFKRSASQRMERMGDANG
jgi:hypothetical protein